MNGLKCLPNEELASALSGRSGGNNLQPQHQFQDKSSVMPSRNFWQQQQGGFLSSFSGRSNNEEGPEGERPKWPTIPSHQQKEQNGPSESKTQEHMRRVSMNQESSEKSKKRDYTTSNNTKDYNSMNSNSNNNHNNTIDTNIAPKSPPLQIENRIGKCDNTPPSWSHPPYPSEDLSLASKRARAMEAERAARTAALAYGIAEEALRIAREAEARHFRLIRGCGDGSDLQQQMKYGNGWIGQEEYGEDEIRAIRLLAEHRKTLQSLSSANQFSGSASSSSTSSPSGGGGMWSSGCPLTPPSTDFYRSRQTSPKFNKTASLPPPPLSDEPTQQRQQHCFTARPAASDQGERWATQRRLADCVMPSGRVNADGNPDERVYRNKSIASPKSRPGGVKKGIFNEGKLDSVVRSIGRNMNNTNSNKKGPNTNKIQDKNNKKDEPNKTKKKTANSNKSKNSSSKKNKPVDMPRRPLNAYNIFFSEERERILKSLPSPTEKSDDDTTKSNSNPKDKTESDPSSSRPASPLSTINPPRLANVMQRPLERNARERRPHRASHGKIGFKELARLIAKRWKVLPEETMKHYRHLAELDLRRHKFAMEEYRKKKLKEQEEGRLEEQEEIGSDDNVGEKVVTEVQGAVVSPSSDGLGPETQGGPTTSSPSRKRGPSVLVLNDRPGMNNNNYHISNNNNFNSNKRMCNEETLDKSGVVRDGYISNTGSWNSSTTHKPTRSVSGDDGDNSQGPSVFSNSRRNEGTNNNLGTFVDIIFNEERLRQTNGYDRNNAKKTQDLSGNKTKDVAPSKHERIPTKDDQPTSPTITLQDDNRQQSSKRAPAA